MILLFEGHKYPKHLVKEYLDKMNLDGIRKGADWESVSYVGYFYHTNLEHPDIVYILPKVFVYKKENDRGEYVSEDDDVDYGKYDSKKNKDFLAFGEFDPCDLIDVSKKKDDKEFMKKFGKYKDFIQQLAIWVYITVHRYHNRDLKNHACISSFGRTIYSNGKKKRASTLNDLILSLRQFAEDNKNFFTFVLKQSHSGFNKVNWRKTVSKSLPLMQGGKPIYLNLNTKKKTVNYDEELLVILFSTLRYIRDEYDYNVFINENFNLMSKKEYLNFMKRGVKKMLELKYKYFSDKTIELWTLLFDYFKKSEELSSNKTKNDYLLVNSFHVVFEDMIDYLISDEPDQYPKEMKSHADGKEVDHIYSEPSLTYEQMIYYVGDSKYYKVSGELEKKSIKKQYTYAKNIIQRNIDVIHGFDKSKNKDKHLYYRYRDELTEGYNITPNFFISGMVNRDKETSFNFTDDMLNVSFDTFEPNRHFINRLFDRDTLILQRYNINFLFVLSLYARNKDAARMKFREKARKAFKENLIKHLEQNYRFFKIDFGEEDKEDFVESNFKYLTGKFYQIDNGIILLGWQIGADNQLVIDKYVTLHENEDGTYLMIIKPMISTNANRYVRSYILYPWSLKDGKVAEYTTGKVNYVIRAKNAEIDELGFDITQSRINENVITASIEKYYEDDFDEFEKYIKYLPVTTVKAACGAFIDNEPMTINYWIKSEDFGIRCHGKEYVIVQAVGHSMEDKIHDGDLCLFQLKCAYSRGDIVLACINDLDENYGGRYSIKKYDREKSDVDGEYVRTKVQLTSINRDYPDFEFTKDDEGVGIVGVFKEVISL